MRVLMTGGKWRYSTANAPANWAVESSDDSSWTLATGPNTIAVITTVSQGPIFCGLDLVEID